MGRTKSHDFLQPKPAGTLICHSGKRLLGSHNDNATDVLGGIKYLSETMEIRNRRTEDLVAGLLPFVVGLVEEVTHH